MAFGVIEPTDINDGWWNNLPVIGGVVQWTQATAQQALALVRAKIGQFRQARAELPGQREAYTRAIVVAREAGPEQREKVAAWGEAISNAESAMTRSGGAIEQVASWIDANPSGLSGLGSGLGAIPLAVLAVLALVVWGLEQIVTNWQRARMLEQQVRAGFTPDQIVRAGLNRGGSLFGIDFGAVSGLAWAGVVVVALLAAKPLLAKIR